MKSSNEDFLEKRLIYNLNEENKLFFDQHINNVETLEKITSKNKAKLLIFTIPINVKFCSESYEKSIYYIFEKFKTIPIDLIKSKLCLRDQFYYPINGHLNKKGHEYMAEKISDYLSGS